MNCKALEKAKRRFGVKDQINEELGFNHGPKVIEREVKKYVKEIIKELEPDADIFMPVQSGYGNVDLDFIVGIRGYYLSIECKCDGKKPTHRQLQTIEKKVKAGCVCLIIDQSNLEFVAYVVGSIVYGVSHENMLYEAKMERKRYMER